MNPALQHYGSAPHCGNYYCSGLGCLCANGCYQCNPPAPPYSPPVHLNAVVDSCSAIAQNRPPHTYIAPAMDLNLTPQVQRRRLWSLSPPGSVSSSTSQRMDNIASTSATSNAFIQQDFAPRGTDIAKLDKETLARMMPYNENMARKFPEKERTAQEQERRNKNTFACRVSRCKEKIKLATMEHEYALLKERNDELTKEMLPMAAYLNELIRCGVAFKPDARNEAAMTLGKILSLRFLANMPIKKAAKRNFSIAFLLDMD